MNTNNPMKTSIHRQSLYSLSLFCLLMFLALPMVCPAQRIQHDKQKEKQWQSMETGPWGFAPGWYYYLFHKKYSGAYLHFAWLGTKVKFKESKSNVRTIMPTRTAEEEEQRAKMKKVEEERQQIEPLYREELARQADRAVDAVYTNYKSEFNRMQDRISEGLAYCMTKSKGKLSAQVSEIQRRNEVICQSIAYIHETGYRKELENAKRQQAYSDFSRQMEDLVNEVVHLVGMAQRYY
jgi:hypothetical protein